jgi:hypothetical protein
LRSTWCFSPFWHEISPKFLLLNGGGAKDLSPLHFKDLVDCISFSLVLVSLENYLCCVVYKKKKKKKI